MLPIFDGHNDTISRLTADRFIAGAPEAHLDLPRAGQAGFAGGLFATFVTTASGEPLSQRRALAEIMPMVDRLRDIEQRAGDRFALCTDLAGIERAMVGRKLAVVWHCEGAEIVDPSLDNLEELYRTGLRSLGLVWNRTNAFGMGVGPADTDEGLTPDGRTLVRRCNELGILIDLSHLNQPGFRDVARITDRPLVATHANARRLCDHPRNLTDDQLTAIRRTNGLVGINFCVAFLKAGGTTGDVGLDAIVDHAACIADRIGIEHVALGSDFDGADVPDELSDVTGLPALLDRFTARGFDAEAIDQIAHRNWLRILRATWR